MTSLLQAAPPAVTGVEGLAAIGWLLIALPALGALILLVAGRRANAWGHYLGCLTVLGAFGYGLAMFLETTGLEPGQRVQEVSLFQWIPVNALHVDFGLRLDPLSLVFVLLITGVGSLIHIYSIGYMAHSPADVLPDGAAPGVRAAVERNERRRFFAYLNLFVAAMLLLVLGNGFVTLYFGWEGVGLASYLLISFWQRRPEAGTAAKKAFLMNRVGDLGLAIAIFLMFNRLGTTQYTEVFNRVGEFTGAEILAISLLLLLGACGKSGQFPLQAWLPDAMAGPTPVSALIHAATMVTAGVYLVARSAPIFNLTPDGRLVVMLVGAVTLIIGCVIGCAYDDFKKVLAYSTVSQIGYMILAVGLGPFGYALGIMHLLTHGFFKAGLFLGAGSVMHGMNDEGDIRRMGGLARFMPVTFVTWTLGYLALIGFPFLSGYYSKDAIIEAAFAQEGWRGWVFGGVAVFGAMLTAFYMTRLLMLVFLGERRWERLTSADGRRYHPHESPSVMTVPMIVLAVGSVAVGYVLHHDNLLADWLTPSVGALEHGHGAMPHELVPVLTVALSAVGALIAYLMFRTPQPVERPVDVAWPRRAARADLYANAVNENLFARPGAALAAFTEVFDRRVVDGLVHGTGGLLTATSGALRKLQTGYARSYALSILAGAVVLFGALLMVRFS